MLQIVTAFRGLSGPLHKSISIKLRVIIWRALRKTREIELLKTFKIGNVKV